MSKLGDIAIETKARLTFPGGVHPAEHKSLTENSAIAPGPKPKQIQVLLSQHIGAPCKALVAKRDTVEAGQVIGQSEAFVSAPVHTPFAGKVKDIALASHPVLGRTTAIIIDVADDPTKPVIEVPDIQSQGFSSNFDPSGYNKDEICSLVSEAGIVGMGGAGFPTRVKMEANPKMPLETMILNACECEPYITCDYRMVMEWTDKIIVGVKLIVEASGCKQAFIGIEDNKPHAIKLFEEVLKNSKHCEHIKVAPVKTKYPQGGEKQLIRSILKKDVPDGGIPPMIGVLVCNVATAVAISDGVVNKVPLTHRVVTVSGGGINNPGNFYCAIGTPVQDLLDFCGGLKDTAVKVIMGGPMMGFSIADMTTPLTKTSGAITVLTEKEIGRAKYRGKQTACIRCGRCLDVCPVNLNPTKIAHAVKHNMLDIAKEYNMASCIECGCCSYTCPANVEVTGYIKTGKILDARQKKLMPQ